MNLIVFDENSKVNAATLAMIAHLPTKSLYRLVTLKFWNKLSDADFMRIAVLLAEKSYSEGGCPIGAVVVDRASNKILGKGHNTLVQENHPYNHGETSAMRDAGSIDYSLTTVFTTLTPCRVCATLMVERGVSRVVIGDSPDLENNEGFLRQAGVEVLRLDDPEGISLYAKYRAEKPDLDLTDWKGVAGMRKIIRSSTQDLSGLD
jgi:creatinine deaminase